MKKTILLSLAVLITVLFNHSSGMDTGGSPSTPEPSRITTLIVNANVTVVLVNNYDAEIEVKGDDLFTKFVFLRKAGDTLVIGSTKFKNLKKNGVIYVPASQLRNIRINSEAYLRSLSALHVPKLDVIVNGACKFVISNMGELNVVGSDFYSVEEKREIRFHGENGLVTRERF